MRLAAMFSGGKDSTFAVWKALQEGHKIEWLLGFESENPDSYMFHYPNIRLIELQARAMSMKLKLVGTKGIKEKELDDIVKAVEEVREDIDGVVSGALASEYQRTRIEDICKELGLECLSPLWGIKPDNYWKELLDNRFRVIVTKVACEGLGDEWLGREITRKSFKELKDLSERYRFHLGFEGGEAETFVVDCPMFSGEIKIFDSEKLWEGDSGIFRIKKAFLAGKA